MHWMKQLIVVICLSTSISCEISSNGVDEELSKQSFYYGLVSMSQKNPQNTVCLRELTRTAKGILEGNRWAKKMYDASGSPRTGLVWSNTYWLGNRRQCEASMVITNLLVGPHPEYVETQEGVPPFPVAYYGAYFKHSSDLQMKLQFNNEDTIALGLCLPSSCEEAEIYMLLQSYFDNDMLYLQRVYNMSMKMESIKRLHDDFSWMKDKSTIALGLVMTILILLGISGTAYDILIYQPYVEKQNKSMERIDSNGNFENATDDSIKYQQVKKRTCSMHNGMKSKMALSFSIHRNSKFIFNTDIGENTIKCIHGLRVISMLHIILGHMVVFLSNFYDNRPYAFLISDWYVCQIFGNSHFSVDTYYCMSGYLVTYLFFKAKINADGFKRKIKLFVSLVVNRFARLIPSYSIAILFTTVLTIWRMKTTIFWITYKDDVTCPNYWWRSLLFITTWYPRDEMCLAWSWFLSLDMQFYITISILLILAKTNFKLATSIFIFMFVYFIGLSAFMTYINEYIPVSMRMYNLREIFYDSFLIRFGPYAVGVMGGYLGFYLNKKLPLNKYAVKMIWFYYICAGLMFLFGFGNFSMSLSSSMIYVPLGRIIWTANVVWVIIACETGNGGLINRILCAKFWIPMSRVTFWAFFMNPVIMFLGATFNERALESDIQSKIFLFPGYVLYSYLAAYVFTLIVELPITGIIKVFDKDRATTTQAQKFGAGKTNLDTKNILVKNEKNK